MIENELESRLIKEIVLVTSKLRNNYPELHKQIIERATFFENGKKDEIDINDLKRHFENLNRHLEMQSTSHTTTYSKRVLETA